jgi:hypothetical protein
MTANFRIIPRNFHDEATLTITASGELNSDFAVTNTQLHPRSSVWRSNAAPGGPTPSSIDIKGTFSRNRKVTFFGAFRHLCHGSKFRLQLYSDAAWAVSVYDSTALDALQSAWINNSGYAWGDDPYTISAYDPLVLESPFWLWFTEKTIRSYKLTVSNYTVGYGPDYLYWQIGRLWLGRHIEPLINPDFGLSIGWQDNTQRSRTQGGSLRTVLGNRWRVMKMTLGRVDETERAFWLDMLAFCQLGNDIVVSVFPEEASRRERDHLLDCKMSTLDVLGRQVSWLEKTLALEEL